MHMADALISPAVGGAGWAAALGIAAAGARKIRRGDDAMVPMMGVGASFVFAAQMINFAIPGTGSSGHLGGGLLLAALLGPHAAFLAMASILSVQALFFADGGLLALGCNIVNLGLFPCYVAYPFLLKPIAGREPSRGRLATASTIAAIAGLELGALGVIAETKLSHISALPTGSFLLLMLPIHLAIGVVEGLATSAVLLFVRRARPSAIGAFDLGGASAGGWSRRKLAAGLLVAALAMGAVLSWFASSKPDGLEWSVERAASGAELGTSGAGAHGIAAAIQKNVSILPDYALPTADAAAPVEGRERDAAWPAVSAGTSAAGVVGAAFALLVAGILGVGLRRRKPLGG